MSNADRPAPRGAELISAERQRQIESEGWTPEHDAEHYAGELLKAAVAYLDCNETMQCRKESFVVKDVRANSIIYDDPWPWSNQWDKRQKHDRIRRLAIAGALIAAEIDRLEAGEIVNG